MRHELSVSPPAVHARHYFLRNSFTSHADAILAAAHVARRRHVRTAVFNDASGFWRVRVTEAQ